jgi:hypothetical protein
VSDKSSQATALVATRIIGLFMRVGPGGFLQQRRNIPRGVNVRQAIPSIRIISLLDLNIAGVQWSAGPPFLSGITPVLFLIREELISLSESDAKDQPDWKPADPEAEMARVQTTDLTETRDGGRTRVLDRRHHC